VRINLYKIRKENELKIMKKELDINKSKMKFINDVINDKIIVYRNKKENIINKLIELNYIMLIDKEITKYSENNKNIGFNYLINMPLYHLTEDKINELNNEIKDITQKYDALKNKTIEDIWLEELEILKQEYIKFN
jgi:DNA topoisomerase-2